MAGRLAYNLYQKRCFFLTIILCADIKKTIYSVDGKRIIKRKTILYGMSIFILVTSSVLFGSIVIANRSTVDEIVYVLSSFLCGISVLTGCMTQIIVNKDLKDEDKNNDRIK